MEVDRLKMANLLIKLEGNNHLVDIREGKGQGSGVTAVWGQVCSSRAVEREAV